jgi:hypothetical protein
LNKSGKQSQQPSRNVQQNEQKGNHEKGRN